MKSLLLYTTKFLIRSFLRLFFELEITGQEHIPESGRIILAPNHQSNWDPPLIGVAATRVAYFAAKRQLFDRRVISLFLKALNAIPLDRRGIDRSSLRHMKNVLDQGGLVVMFPEGTRSRDGQLGKIRDGIGFLAMQTKADLIPVYLTGTRGARPRLWKRRRLQLRFGKLIEITPYLESDEPRRQLISQISNLVMEGIQNEQQSLLGTTDNKSGSAGSDNNSAD